MKSLTEEKKTQVLLEGCRGHRGTIATSYFTPEKHH